MHSSFKGSIKWQSPVLRRFIMLISISHDTTGDTDMSLSYPEDAWVLDKNDARRVDLTPGRHSKYYWLDNNIYPHSRDTHSKSLQILGQKISQSLDRSRYISEATTSLGDNSPPSNVTRWYFPSSSQRGIKKKKRWLRGDNIPEIKFEF